MIIMPTVLLAIIGIWTAIRGSRTVSIVAWALAILAMLGAMSYHMDSALKIEL
jgi:hypothetical protein